MLGDKCIIVMWYLHDASFCNALIAYIVLFVFFATTHT